MMLRRAENCCRDSSFWCWPLVGTLVLLWLFAPALGGDRILAFRDAAYWHMNTLRWTAEQWQSGSVPLWNDWHGLGVNWVGQGTTTVFYPGTWLLTVPLGQFSQRYTLVMVLHLLGCGWGTMRLARVLGVTPIAACFAALTFVLSGPVLALHGNWPFLIGAAWLPWALSGLWQAIVQRRPSGSWSAAAAVAMMILGGEPQAALLWLLAAMSLVLVHVAQNHSTNDSQPVPSGKMRRLWQSGRTLLLIGLLALAGSGVQWWPLWESSQGSTRAIRSVPSNVYQAAAQWQSGDPDWAAQAAAGLWGAPEPQSQADQALQFSQPPWHWATLFVGNLMGTWRTVHARWDRHLAVNDRVWNPTLYAGAITAVLVCSRWCGLMSVLLRYRRLGRSGRRRWQLAAALLDRTKPKDASESRESLQLSNAWLWSVLVLFGLGSCGWYGAVWLWVEIQGAFGASVSTPSVGPQVGGVYWWLTLLCPGFDQFRYPAKLWIMAAMAWSLLASFELSQWISASGMQSSLSNRLGWNRSIRRGVLGSTIFLLLLLLALGVTSSPIFVSYFFRTFQEVPFDPWLGALQVPAALLELHLSLIHSLVVGGLLCGWLFARNRVPSAWWGWGVVALTLLDVTVNNAWLVQTIDRRALTDTTVWDSATNPYRDPMAAERSLAQQRFWYEPNMMQEHRFQQMSEKWGTSWPWQPIDKLTWQAIHSMRATGAPQFHLEQETPSVNVEQTLEPLGPTLLREEVARLVHTLPPEIGQVWWRNYLRSLGVRYWLSWENSGTTSTSRRALKWVTLPETPPPVWLAQHWDVRPKIPNIAPLAAHIADYNAIWLSDDMIADSPERVVLDHPIVLVSPATQDVASEHRHGIVAWQFSAQEKSAVLNIDRPTILVWRQWHAPGWYAFVQTKGGAAEWQPMMAVQRIFTGLALPPGEHQIRLVYFPTWFWLGGSVTLLSWVWLLGVFVYTWKMSFNAPSGERFVHARQVEKTSQS